MAIKYIVHHEPGGPDLGPYEMGLGVAMRSPAWVGPPWQMPMRPAWVRGRERGRQGFRGGGDYRVRGASVVQPRLHEGMLSSEQTHCLEISFGSRSACLRS